MKFHCLYLLLLLLPSCSIFNQNNFTVESPQECYKVYTQHYNPGYKAFAVAFDYPYFVCGIAAEMAKEKYAVEVALYSCEQGRISPQAKQGGARTVMTRCRIYATDLIE